MTDWEALFAQASDIPASSQSSSKNILSSRPANGENDNLTSDNTGDQHQTEMTEKSRKKRKRQRTSRTSYGSNGCFQRMLNSRLDPPPDTNTPWLSWMTLEQSFLDGNVNYKEQQDGSSSAVSKIQPCKSNRSPISFRLTLAKAQQYSQEESWHLRLFCHNRNIRCCAKLLAQWEAEGDTNAGVESTQDGKGKTASKQHKQRLHQTQQCQKSVFRGLQSEANETIDMLQYIVKCLPNDEANLLISKASDLTGRVENLLRQRKRERKRSGSEVDAMHKDDREAYPRATSELPWSWEPCVRIIMACDAVYYRLYYQQLTGMIPVGHKHHDTGEAWHIPHPHIYFGLDGLTMQSLDQGTKGAQSTSASARLMQSAQKLKDASPELQSLTDHLDGMTNTEEPATHALEAIHHQRFKETMSLFQDGGWTSNRSTLSQWEMSLGLQVDSKSKHETPAPQLLMDWRDSCRDFLCHLYAYATVSSTILRQLVDLLAQLQDEQSIDLSLGVVEVGAGTGYLAEILRAQGIAVQAWDIQPTSINSIGGNPCRMNEYHGNVPSFCDVKKASTFPSTGHANRSALLLCYPPPESSMALNTLAAYRKAGGKCLMHIGEFRGLTGDFKFEKALRKGDMQCVARHPCLGWGTDAAYVTVWVAKDSKPKTLTSASVLLPCSNFNCSKESKHRFRPLRQVVYCSQDCCDCHTPVRNCLLSLFNVPADPNLSSCGIGSSLAFAPL